MRLLFLLFHSILLLFFSPPPHPPLRFSYRAILNIPQRTNGFLVTPLFHKIPHANGHRTWIILQFCCHYQVHSHPEHCPFPDTLPQRAAGWSCLGGQRRPPGKPWKIIALIIWQSEQYGLDPAVPLHEEFHRSLLLGAWSWQDPTCIFCICLITLFFITTGIHLKMAHSINGLLHLITRLEF